MCPRPSQGKLLYHMTLLNNIPSILEKGILSRNKLQSSKIFFYDIADEEIVEKLTRKFDGYDLSDYIHFHFFSSTPFDKSLVCRYGSENLAIIAVFRPTFIDKMKRYKIITAHPLSNRNPEILDYEDGMNSIPWPLLDDYAMGGNAFDFSNSYNRTATMAECIVYERIEPREIAWIFINSNAKYDQLLTEIKQNHPSALKRLRKIVVRNNMFPKIYGLNNWINYGNVSNRTYNDLSYNRTYNDVNYNRTYNDVNYNRTYNDVNYNRANININYNTNYKVYNNDWNMNDHRYSRYHRKKEIKYRNDEESSNGGFFSFLANLCIIC
ncbi:hypothetical protein M9Y10_032098 [Tritrichomonas musculus]|uniref:DarT domain-containing protein n=1 Tax=Tritrichomonas musculus TaxID=1915356 RepID=A0ABR2GZ51_9EUKA